MSRVRSISFQSRTSLNKIHNTLSMILIAIVSMLVFNIFLRSKSIIEENLAYNISDVEYNLKYFSTLSSKRIDEDVWTIPTSIKIVREKNANSPLSIPVHDGFVSITSREVCHYISSNGLQNKEITGLKRVKLQNKWISCQVDINSHRPEIPFLDGKVYVDASSFLTNIFRSDEAEIYVDSIIITLLALLYYSALKKSELTLIQSEKEAEIFQDESSRDFLSGLLNRRGFIRNASKAMTNKQFTFFILDVDNFKQINDVRGHEAGDKVIQTIGAYLSREQLNLLHCSRLGGEEFGGLVPISEPGAITGKLEKIRTDIASLKIPLKDEGEYVTFTVSIGAAIMNTVNGRSSEAMREADKCLYKAKSSGKNCICLSAA